MINRTGKYTKNQVRNTVSTWITKIATAHPGQRAISATAIRKCPEAEFSNFAITANTKENAVRVSRDKTANTAV